MNALLEFLEAHGGMLASGATLILLAGAGAVALARDPQRQRRLAELSLGAVLLWLAAALLPLPRWTLPAWTSGQPIAARLAAKETPPPVVAPGPIPEPHREPHGAPARAATPDQTRDPARPTADQREVPALLEAPAPAGRTLSPAEFLAWLFLAAAALAGFWLLLGALLLVRVLLPARAAPPALRALFHALPGARPSHRLLVSPRARGPFCLGGRRGAVVLPDHMRTSPAPALQALLAHEVAHLEAGDPWRQTLFALATPLLCLHPLFWWLRRRAHLAAEVLADDRAAVLVGKATYARTFIDLAAQGTSRRPRLLAVVPALRSQSEFFRRMTMLLERPQPLPRHTSKRRRLAEVAATALLVVACAGFLGLRPAPAQASPPASVTAQDLDQLRKERDALQREIDALRADIKKLAASMQGQANTGLTYNDFMRALQTTRAPAEPGKQPEAVEVSGELRLESLLRRQAEAAQDAGRAAEAKALWEKAAELDPERAREDAILQAQEGSTLRTLLAQKRARQDTDARDAAPRELRHNAAATAGGDAHVLDLLTRAIDLETEMQLQERKLAHSAELQKRGLGSDGEVAECEARLVGAKRKLALVQSALRAEREATAQEIELLSQRDQAGALDADGRVQLIRARGRLQMLKDGAR